MKKITRTSPKRADLRSKRDLVKFYRLYGVAACLMAHNQFGMSRQAVMRALAPLESNKKQPITGKYVPAVRPETECPKQMCYDHYFDMRAVTIKLGVAGGVKEGTVKSWISQWQHGLEMRSEHETKA